MLGGRLDQQLAAGLGGLKFDNIFDIMFGSKKKTHWTPGKKYFLQDLICAHTPNPPPHPPYSQMKGGTLSHTRQHFKCCSKMKGGPRRHYKCCNKMKGGTLSRTRRLYKSCTKMKAEPCPTHAGTTRAVPK